MNEKIIAELMGRLAVLEAQVELMRNQQQGSKFLQAKEPQFALERPGAAVRYSLSAYQTEAQKVSRVVTIQTGKFYLAGVSTTITGLPSTQAMTANRTSYNYLTVNLAASTVTYTGDSATDPGNGNDTTEYVVLHEITTNASKVTTIINRLTDQRIPRAA